MSTDLVFFTVLFAFLVLEEYKSYHAENEKGALRRVTTGIMIVLM